MFLFAERGSRQPILMESMRILQTPDQLFHTIMRSGLRPSRLKAYIMHQDCPPIMLRKIPPMGTIVGSPDYVAFMKEIEDKLTYPLIIGSPVG